MKVNDDLSHPQKAAAQKVNQLLAANQATLFLVSGGSSLQVLSHVDQSLLHASVTVAALDERFSTDPKNNNCAQFLATDFGDGVQSQASIIDTRISIGETRREAAKKFQSALQKWIRTYPEGQVIATVGIGDDGHVAGILPDDNAARFRDRFMGEDLVADYQVPESVNEHTQRFTTTLTFLKNHLNVAVVYAAGEKKRAILQKLVDKKEPLHTMPAQILKSLPATLFTDIDLKR